MAVQENERETERSAESSEAYSQQLALTPTVEGVLKRFSPDEVVTAADFVNAILDSADHRKAYAAGRFAELTLVETEERRPAEEWLTYIQAMFDTSRMQSLESSSVAPRLHGRLAILGLAMLDGDLYRQLSDAGSLEALQQEVEPPIQDLNDILSERGREMYAERLTDSTVYDTVPPWPDDPVRAAGQDQLGRGAFARFLAGRIRAVPADAGAYSVHLYAPWGAGKSSLLNLLSGELSPSSRYVDRLLRIATLGLSGRRRDWSVVRFNAWRNQHIDPPWWPLLDTIYRSTKGRLALWHRFLEWGWRLVDGRIVFLASLALLLWGLAIILWFFPELLELGALEGAAKSVTTILALVGTVWGGITAFNRSLLLGSARVAATYKERVHDPMTAICKRFKKLIRRLSPRRVAVFIDDLDRCQSKYVVDLLEGIQTLFRDAPVIFVIAADNHWLNACFAIEYEKLAPHIREEGKKLGTLFLEKAFRFSTPLPGAPDELKRQYWQHLLQLRSGDDEEDPELVRQGAESEVRTALGEQEVREIVEASAGRTFAERQALREAAAVRMAAPEVVQRLEHTLKPYSELLDPNPRSMKRLVNMYSSYRALALLADIDIEQHPLALWTILSARWPELAAHLEEYPDQIQGIGHQPPENIDESLKELFRSTEVETVVGGGSLGDKLQEADIEKCRSMHA